jgi:hypothetical protein
MVISVNEERALIYQDKNLWSQLYKIFLDIDSDFLHWYFYTSVKEVSLVGEDEWQ